MKQKLFIKNKLHQAINVIVLLISGLTATALNAAQVSDQPLTTPILALAGTQVVTTDWLLKLPNQKYLNNSFEWLDNAHLIFAMPSLDTKQKTNIELINIYTSKRTLLGEGSNPKPSPDGQWIAFTKGEDDARQLWLMKNNGTDVKQLSHVEGGLFGYNGFSYDIVWSPDSKKIALKHQRFTNPWEKTKLPESIIDVINLTGQSQQILSVNASLRSLSWFPNNEELLFMKERIGDVYNVWGDQDWIQSVRISDGRVRTLVEFDGLQQFLDPVCSPDRKQVAFTYDADHPMYTYMTSIGLISADSVASNTTSQITRLTNELKLYSLQWSHDSKRIYARRDYGAYKQIYAIDAKTGEASQITDAPLNIQRYALSPNGSQLAWLGEDAHGTYILRVSNNNGKNIRDIMVMPTAPSGMALSEVREIDWAVPNYPVHMRGLLFLPLRYQEKKRYPLIVYIHGGGASAAISLNSPGILTSSPLEWQLWTAKGYAVFVPEMRSSASFGSLAITRDELQEHNLIHCDIMDIEAGVDALITRGIADGHRLAVIGHSAGGRRANSLTVLTHRYQAVISHDGWADELLDTIKHPIKRVYLMFGGSPLQVPQNYLKNSALFHSAGATTPTLFLMANPKLGGADPNGTVDLLNNALKAQGVETQFIYYPDEGHIFEKATSQRDAIERSVKWIDDHMRKKNRINGMCDSS